MNNLSKTAGDKIRYLQKQSQLDEIALALYLDIEPKELIRIENNEMDVSITLLEKVADLYDIELSELIDNDTKFLPKVMNLKDFAPNDLKTIATINKIAKNVRFMGKTLEKE